MSRVSTALGRGFVAALCACCASAAFAIPVKYEFATGATIAPQILANGAVFQPVDPVQLTSLTGFAVSGSFYYDADAPVSFAVTTGANAGSTIHDGAFTNLIGSIDGLAFSDALGSAQIGDDTFGLPSPPGVPPKPPVDFLQLSTLSVSGAADFVGGSVNGLQLTGVRMFWIEGQAVPDTISDFVSGPGLLSAPPGFAGRIALDFGVAGLPTTPTLFRDNLIITRAPTAVSEPESFALLVLGLVALAPRVRRARATSI